MRGFVRGLALILTLLIMVACIPSNSMEVIYTVRSGETLKGYTVYLVVNDKRRSNDLVGSEAKQRGMFEELKSGHIDLRVDLPTGSKVIMTKISAIEAVRESASRRLQSQGVTSTNIRSAAQLTMEINIDEMDIDLMDGDLLATVALSADIYRDRNTGPSAKSNAKATSNRMKLIGGTGGATVLSEALTQAMNDLDFGGINDF